MRFLSLPLSNFLQTPSHLLYLFFHFPCCYSVNSPLNPILLQTQNLRADQKKESCIRFT